MARPELSHRDHLLSCRPPTTGLLIFSGVFAWKRDHFHRTKLYPLQSRELSKLNCWGCFFSWIWKSWSQRSTWLIFSMVDSARSILWYYSRQVFFVEFWDMRFFDFRTDWQEVKCSFIPILGGGLNYFFIFSPILGKIPIWTNMFQMGWFNHQPEFVSPPSIKKLGSLGWVLKAPDSQWVRGTSPDAKFLKIPGDRWLLGRVTAHGDHKTIHVWQFGSVEFSHLVNFITIPVDVEILSWEAFFNGCLVLFSEFQPFFE